MKFDSVMSAIELGEASSKPTDEFLEVMCGEIEGFMRAERPMRFEEWVRLDPVTKSIFIECGNSIRKELAYMIGMAARSEVSAEYLRGEEEGHDAVAHGAVDFMCQKAMGKLSKDRMIETKDLL